VAFDQLNFGTTPSVVDRWYPITISGARVRDCTAISISGSPSCTLDLKNGRVRFTGVQSSNLTGTVSAPAITSSDTGCLQAITPLQTFRFAGIGDLYCYDADHPNNLIIHHQDFGCEIMVESIDEWDGSKWGVATLKVKVVDPVSTIYIAE
jgi:hypothetical protein